MTQKEIDLINAINCDNLNNSQWGIVSAAWDIATLHDAAESDKTVPPHIFVYRECNECYLRNEIVPDYTFRDRAGQVIDLYYLTF